MTRNEARTDESGVLLAVRQPLVGTPAQAMMDVHRNGLAQARPALARQPRHRMHHPDRVARLFAFAANSDPSGVKDVDKSPVFQQFIARGEKEYEALSATPREYKKFVDEISTMPQEV